MKWEMKVTMYVNTRPMSYTADMYMVNPISHFVTYISKTPLYCKTPWKVRPHGPCSLFNVESKTIILWPYNKNVYQLPI